MKHYRLSVPVLLALYAFGQAPAIADFSYGPFSLSAFGTLGGAWLSNEHVDYTQGTQPVGPGISHDFDLGLDSRLGAQLNIALTPSTLITAQTVVERLSDNEFQPRLTQANIRQEIGEDFAIRVGRIQSPIFLASDYRLANFSNPWVRTPSVVYDLYSLTHIDSVDLTYEHGTGLGTLSFNVGYGWVKFPFPTMTNGSLGTMNIHLDDVVYANLKLDNGPWRVKLSWGRSRLTFRNPDNDRLAAGLAMFDPGVSEDLEMIDRGYSLYTAGFSYDDGGWLVMGEWGLTRSDEAAMFYNRQGSYLTVGYHLDRWLPQITVGFQETSGRRVRSANAMADAIIAEVHQQQRTDYRTVAVGLNYAATDTLMLRGQVDIIDPMDHSLGPYFQADSRYDFDNPGQDVLLSLSLDFIY